MISRARVFDDGERGRQRVQAIMDRLSHPALWRLWQSDAEHIVTSIIVEYEKALTAFDKPEDAERVHG